MYAMSIAIGSSGRIEIRTLENSPLSDISGRDIKCPGTGTIQAAGGSICHDEIVVWVGVPRPDGVTAFHHVIDDERVSRLENVSAIAAYIWGYGSIEINGDVNCNLGRIVDPELDGLPLQHRRQDFIFTWICTPGIVIRSRS